MNAFEIFMLVYVISIIIGRQLYIKEAIKETRLNGFHLSDIGIIFIPGANSLWSMYVLLSMLYKWIFNNCEFTFFKNTWHWFAGTKQIETEKIIYDNNLYEACEAKMKKLETKKCCSNCKHLVFSDTCKFLKPQKGILSDNNFFCSYFKMD